MLADPQTLCDNLMGALDGWPGLPPHGAAYAIRVEPTTSGPAQPLHLLFEANRVMVRTRDPRRVVGELFSHVEVLRAANSSHLPLLDGLGLVRGGGAVVGPALLRRSSAGLDRRLARLGWGRAPGPGALVDVASAQVVVAGLGDAEAAEACLQGVEAFDGTDRLAVPAPFPGRYPIHGVLAPSEPQTSRARMLIELGWGLRGRAILDADLLHGLGRLLARRPLVVGPDDGLEAAIQALPSGS